MSIILLAFCHRNNYNNTGENVMPDILVRTEAFEGPLDLLCHLIDKNEVSIYDIPIALITGQYLDWMEAHFTGDGVFMENLSEFAVMAATLLEIKSAMLLPGKKSEADGEEEEDPRTVLVRRLEEYRRVKEAAEELKELEAEAVRTVYGRPDPTLPRNILERAAPDIAGLLDGITLDALYRAFTETLARRESKVDVIRSGFNAVRRETFTVAVQQDRILEMLRAHQRLKFNGIFGEDASRAEIIVTFLALLELLRMGLAAVFQEVIFGDIYIRLTGTDKKQ